MLNREQINAKISKRCIIVNKKGDEYPVDDHNQINIAAKNYPLLNKFILDEHGLNSNNSSPKSIQVMQKLELVDYEAASDSGHFRFYPKGNLIFDLIKSWAEEIAQNKLNALKIETPLIYDYNEPDIKEQVQSFHENHYIVNAPGKEKEFILRFAGDFGLFRMLKEASLSYKALPLRIYEFSKSFRYEKSGSLVGLKRLRGFSMPDIHSFTEDISQGFSEYKELYKNFYDLAKSMDVKFVPVFRAVESFYYKNKAEILELINYGDSPVYIELLSEMKHYWAIKSEFQVIDFNNSFMQLSTVQLDIKDAKIYGINYLDKLGEEKGCTICHSSIGSIERWMYAVLENSLMKEKPMLPYWLSPIQLRIIPVSDEYLDESLKLAKNLYENNIRIDIDDRDERVGRKIRISEQNWIPYVLVIGENERSNKIYSLRCRDGNETIALKFDDLISHLKTKQNNMPYIKLNLNKLLSKQPIFR